MKARLGLVAKWNEGDSLTVLFSYPWLFLSKHLRNKRNERMKWYTDKQTDMKRIEKKSKHEIPQFAHRFFSLLLFPLPFWNVLIYREIVYIHGLLLLRHVISHLIYSETKTYSVLCSNEQICCQNEAFLAAVYVFAIKWPGIYFSGRVQTVCSLKCDFQCKRLGKIISKGPARQT